MAGVLTGLLMDVTPATPVYLFGVSVSRTSPSMKVEYSDVLPEEV